jgi:hypothetical protein
MAQKGTFTETLSKATWIPTDNGDSSTISHRRGGFSLGFGKAELEEWGVLA